MEILDCLINIIGLSDIECECIEDDRPEDWNVSKSGFYMTDLEFGVSLKKIVFLEKNCYNGRNIWEILQAAIKSATISFQTDLLSEIYNKKDSAVSAFSGDIGKQKATTTILPSKAFQGICINPKKLKGGCLVISSIAVGLDCSTPVTVNISDNKGQSFGSVLINTVAGQYTRVNLPNPVELPLVSGDCDLKYFIWYQLPSGCSALQNKFRCCSDKWGWEKYIEVGGVDSNTFQNVSPNSNLAWGLCVGSHLSCNALEWLCNIDFKDYSRNGVIGKAILLKAAAIVNSIISKSDNPNYFTLSNPKVIASDIKENEKRYYEYIEWLAVNVPLEKTDCFTCKESEQKLKRVSIY